MTQVSLTQLKASPGKYITMAGDQDILISRNGEGIAKVDKVAAARELLSMFPKGMKVDYDEAREERLMG